MTLRVFSLLCPFFPASFLSVRLDTLRQAEDLIHLCVRAKRGRFRCEVGWVKVLDSLFPFGSCAIWHEVSPTLTGVGGPWGEVQHKGSTSGFWWVVPRAQTFPPCPPAASWAFLLSHPTMPAPYESTVLSLGPDAASTPPILSCASGSGARLWCKVITSVVGDEI